MTDSTAESSKLGDKVQLLGGVSMKIAFTGHRPDKLGGYYDNPISKWVRNQLNSALHGFNPSVCISGMALGVDQIAAELCIQRGIPFIAAVPFVGQEKAWPEDSQRKYWEIIAKASEVVLVTPGGYSPEAMQDRNEWMVDNSDLLIAVWDGSRGGTANAIRYAELIKRPVVRIDPSKRR